MASSIKQQLQDKHGMTNGALGLQGNARIKVEQDIAFLGDRIKVMQTHPKPNTMLIEHYQSMLKSRESVLKWLLDGSNDEANHLLGQRGA